MLGLATSIRGAACALPRSGGLRSGSAFAKMLSTSAVRQSYEDTIKNILVKKDSKVSL